MAGKVLYRFNIHTSKEQVGNIGMTKDMFLAQENRYTTDQSNFSKIPGSPVAYWVSDKIVASFGNKFVSDYAISNGQNITGNNNRFLRLFWEVDSSKIRKDYWAKCARGGGYRKYHGNDDNVILWTSEAKEHYRRDSIARIVPEQLRFKEGITWSYITTNIPSFRKLWEYELFEKAGTSIFVKDTNNLSPLLGLLNSAVARKLLGLINPTINYQVRDIFSIPVVSEVLTNNNISRLVEQNIALTQADWDSFENSWDFLVHPLVLAAEVPNLNGGHKASLSDSYSKWEVLCEKRFNQLKANEEELNRIFIDIYGLQDELTPDVEDKDVTVRKADLGRDIRSLLSYAVGCTNTAFNYLKANANAISGNISTANKDYIISYQDLNGIGMTKHLTLPTLIAICSVALARPTVTGLAVLGDISISGTILKVEDLANVLQVCLDSGAKKVLLPITSAADIGTVPSELVGAFSLIFYSTPTEAVFKALGVD